MNAREYWNRKIIGWEFSRYSLVGALNPASWSVRSRLMTAGQFLNGILVRKSQVRILELGCGSGELVKQFEKYPDLEYWGFDIADKAIEKANLHFTHPQFRFFAQDIEEVAEFPTVDFAVLLGVTDWISENSLHILLRKIQAGYVLISFTEKKRGTRNGLYSLYRLLRDRKSHQTVTYAEDEFMEVCKNSGWILETDLTKKSMLPGRLLWLKKSILTQ
jgi:SAM-dependent methyltransferase